MGKITKVESLTEDRRRMLEDSARYIEAMGLPLYLQRLQRVERELRDDQNK